MLRLPRSIHIVLLFVAMAGASALARAQQPVQWRSLGWFPFEEVTGKRDSVMKSARSLAFDTYLFRTDYRADRTAANGKQWRSAYLTAQIDCGKRTLRIIRTDYYSIDSTFVDTVPADITFTAAEIAKQDVWVAFYNFACAIRKEP